MNAFVRYTVYGIYKLVYNLTVEGRENIPENEGVVIASNHRSYADPVFLTFFMRKPVTYMAKEELFSNKIFGAFIRFLGAFPVKRGTGDLKVIDDCVDILNSGRNVVIFPEGTRSKTNKVGAGKSGVALIAAKSGADVLPVGICFEGKLKFRRRVIIRIGQVIKAEDLAVTDASPKELRKVKQRIMSAISDLVDGARTRVMTKKELAAYNETHNTANDGDVNKSEQF